MEAETDAPARPFAFGPDACAEARGPGSVPGMPLRARVRVHFPDPPHLLMEEGH